MPRSDLKRAPSGAGSAPGPARNPPGSTPDGAEEPPPFGSWFGLYALVALGLLMMIVVCAAITRWGR